MAVKSIKVQSDLIIKYKYGVDDKGNDILKNQKFSKVKVTGTDDDLLEVGTAIGNLLEYPIINIIRQDHSIVISE